ncbi:MAG: PAS domain-containing protein [Blastocatellales bacterium]|nr:PAS domain-containing protein [Blastocatellales bacterium]
MRLGWRLRWDPSVRTRHLVAVMSLVLAAVALLTGFGASRLLGVKLIAIHRAEQALADALYLIAQRTILENPDQEPPALLGSDQAVRQLLELSTGPEREFAYAALVAVDGAPIVEARRPARRTSQPIESLERSFWPVQLWKLRSSTENYELRTLLKLNNEPFVQIIAGVDGHRLRNDLRTPMLLTFIFGASLLGASLLAAVLASPLVLKPLREVVASVEQLEAEAAALGDSPSGAGPDHAHNITQRLRILGRRFAGNRSELEMTRDQLRQVVGGLSERIILLDREQRVMLASPEAERLLGGEGRLARGRALHEALGPSHPLTQLAARAYAAGKSLQEVTPLSANGADPVRVAVAVQLLRDRATTAGALVALRDFAAIEQIETQLDFATRLAALNRITAGVAHEVKNPLHAMVLHLELLNAKLASGGDPSGHVGILVSEVQRLNRVVQTFLDFNRPVELRPQPVNTTSLIREVLRLAADTRAQGITVVERYCPDPLSVKADSDLLKQALLNIIINGCQAMPDGGRLIVETARTGEGFVEISICDEGPGIPQEIREKIFNLYFTTKPQGSGIGLAQAFRAVQLHQGRIEADSAPGGGACFRIVLPAG